MNYKIVGYIKNTDTVPCFCTIIYKNLNNYYFQVQNLDGSIKYLEEIPINEYKNLDVFGITEKDISFHFELNIFSKEYLMKEYIYCIHLQKCEVILGNFKYLYFNKSQIHDHLTLKIIDNINKAQFKFKEPKRKKWTKQIQLLSSLNPHSPSLSHSRQASSCVVRGMPNNQDINKSTRKQRREPRYYKDDSIARVGLCELGKKEVKIIYVNNIHINKIHRERFHLSKLKEKSNFNILLEDSFKE